MSTDLREVFDQAGRHAPAPTLDTDLVVRRGRGIKARRRRVLGAAAAVCAVFVVVGSAAVAGDIFRSGGPSAASTAATPVGPTETPTPSVAPTETMPMTIPTTSADGPVGPYPYPPPPADLVAVALTDPAPGFPYRMLPGSPLGVASLDNSPTMYWTSSFQVGTRPPGTTVYPPGVFQQVNIDVSHSPLPPLTAAGTIDGAKVTGTVQVAGVTGYLTTWTEKGATYHDLYFTTAQFSVRLIGTANVTTHQLVTLGDSLTGIH
jgi:hypothetical protein